MKKRVMWCKAMKEGVKTGGGNKGESKEVEER